MKTFKHAAKATFLFSFLVITFMFTQGFQSSAPIDVKSENSVPSVNKKVKVKVKVSIGRAGCASGAGICGVVITTGNHWKNMAELNSNECYATITYDNNSFVLETAKDLMSESLFNQYFSGTTFQMSDDWEIPSHSIENINPMTIKSGWYQALCNNESFHTITIDFK